MKICPNCKTHLRAKWECPSCNWVAVKSDGFFRFAPELAQSDEGFKSEYFEKLSEIEEDNFWFKARNKLLVWVVQRYFPDASSLFEIGCGTGYVLSGLKLANPKMELSGSEILSAGLYFAEKRVKDVALFQMDAREIPFENEFDVIGIFDVLEHIEDDELVLRQIYQALKPNGGVILSVPQHPLLWSQQDEIACHVRRYRKCDLIHKLLRANFRVEMATSFVSILLPLMMMMRLRRRVAVNQYDPMTELKLSKLTNTTLGFVMNIERFLIKCGLRFPLGGSLVAVASK